MTDNEKTLNIVRHLYDDVALKILASKKGSKDHLDLIKIEKRIGLISKRLKSKMGILAKDPCQPSMPCFFRCVFGYINERRRKLVNCELINRERTDKNGKFEQGN